MNFTTMCRIGDRLTFFTNDADGTGETCKQSFKVETELAELVEKTIETEKDVAKSLAYLGGIKDGRTLAIKQLQGEYKFFNTWSGICAGIWFMSAYAIAYDYMNDVQ